MALQVRIARAATSFGITLLAVAACVYPEYESSLGERTEDGGSGDGAEGGGAAGAASEAGSEDVVYGLDEASCASMTGTECHGESCCTSIVLPGGSFPMGRSAENCTGCTDGCPDGVSCDTDEQPEHSVTVSGFALDKYEVTVGRFRAFVEAGGGTQASPPPAGDGAHPSIEQSGWNSAWNSYLPTDQAGLARNVRCNSTNRTWTDSAGENEQYPMNCVSWFEAFAFCIWDGGRLPTEAEWEYAAAGGDENRLYPWGDDVAEPLPANYAGTGNRPTMAVGSYPDGNGRWGHADLAGSVWEWVLDWYESSWYTMTRTTCTDCASLTAVSSNVLRGGYWDDIAGMLRVANRGGNSRDDRLSSIGWRCSRSAP